jgi:hypothetical protein
MSLTNILSAFEVPDSDYTFEQITTGHINNSYAVINSKSQRTYLLQQIDTEVFQDVPMIMNNIRVVIDHIEKKQGSEKVELLSLVNTRQKESYHISPAGQFWRLYHYINGVTQDKLETVEEALEAGRMFGAFLASLSDLDPAKVGETIPDFHNMYHRFRQFDQARKEATADRLLLAKMEIDFAGLNRARMQAIYDKIAAPEIPRRVVHNDTKLSNLLFNQDGQGLAVIDYDTIMPGYIPFDFGDSVRTICSTTVEDDPDATATRFNTELLRAYTGGFLSQLNNVLTAAEKSLLAEAVPYMPFIMGLRMLTDYLNNDVYYHTRYDVHNLVRAINQFKLVREADNINTEIQDIITS